ncbi:TPA: integrase core domain-containing protein, partial [Klebsiella pneumoniae]
LTQNQPLTNQDWLNNALNVQKFPISKLTPTSKLPITSVHVLNETVLPFFEEHEARVHTILSDNGREFCGRPDHHPYELFLQLEGIEHRTTQVRRSQSNGFIERLHRTLLDEHFRIKGRTTWYETVEQMQTDLESYFDHYNTKRAHQGRMMAGQTPYCMFKKGLKLIPKEQRVKVA